MNFLVQLNGESGQEQRVINASSWSTCLAYCEGTGLTILTIQSIPNAIVNYNVSGNTCYNVSAINSEGGLESHYVWESNFADVSTWVESQGFQSVNIIQSSNKSYVVV